MMWSGTLLRVVCISHTYTSYSFHRFIPRPLCLSCSPSCSWQCPLVSQKLKAQSCRRNKYTYRFKIQNPEQKIRNPVIFRNFSLYLFLLSFFADHFPHPVYVGSSLRLLLLLSHDGEYCIVVRVCRHAVQHKYRGGEGARTVENPALIVPVVYTLASTTLMIWIRKQLMQPLFLPLSPHAARLRNETHTRKTNIFFVFLRWWVWNWELEKTCQFFLFLQLFFPPKGDFRFRRTSPLSQTPKLFFALPAPSLPASPCGRRSTTHLSAKLAAVHAGGLLRVVVVLGVGRRTLRSSLIK